MNTTTVCVIVYAAIVTGIAGAEYVIRRYLERQLRDQLDVFREHRVDERAGYMASLEALTNAVHYGSPTKPEAVVVNREPDVEERASRAFGEQAITMGVTRMRAEYVSAGVPPSEIDDEALRSEVIAMLSGQSPRTPDNLLLVRD